MTVAFVFPGQGSQTPGMGQALRDTFSEARAVFEEVDEALEQNLSRLITEGPEDTLTLTENAQPALMATSMAALRVLQSQGNVEMARDVAYVAGHSLGEYSALAGAGMFSLAHTARLLKTRGQAMQAAVPAGEGAMAAILGLDFEAVSAIAAAAAETVGGVCSSANDNAPGQVVISGNAHTVAKAADNAKEAGAKRAVMLPVSAPFHCALMAPAADVMTTALAQTDAQEPSVPLVANVSADVVQESAHIKELLIVQVTGAVRWRESVLRLDELGVDTIIEIGAGKVLTGLNRRIARTMNTHNVETPADIEAVLDILGK